MSPPISSNKPLTKSQYRDIYFWMGKPLLQDMGIFLHSMQDTMSVAGHVNECMSVVLWEEDRLNLADLPPIAADVLGAEFYAMPAIRTTPINRLRVLADEIQKVAGQLYADSLPRNQDVFDDAKDIRESIGKMIAFAALNTPIRSNLK